MMVQYFRIFLKPKREKTMVAISMDDGSFIFSI